MKKIRKKEKGFSLLELLATILIVSLVLGISGYFIMNTINNSKEKSNIIALNNIKNTANIYTKEYPNDITWNDNKAYVSIQELINKGYLNKEETYQSIKKELTRLYPTNKEMQNKNIEYLILTRDENHNIISIELDIDEDYNINYKKIPIPTSSKYCQSLSYTGEELQLIKKEQLNYSEEIKNTIILENNSGIDAGNYDITIKINPESGYTWEDGSTEDKTITCTIKKAIPKLKPSEDSLSGEDGKNLEDTSLILYSSISGSIKVKSSNKEFATASVENFSTDKNQKGYYEIPATIKKFAKREANTYITFTISPTTEKDKKNYYSGTFVYTIGEVKLGKIAIPECNTPLYYNKKEQTLINDGIGYILLNEKATDEGTYSVTVQLKYGYTWLNGSTDSQTKKCSIQKAMPYITYITNGGTTCNPTKKQVIYQSNYGTLCTTSKSGYTFNGWYTEESSGSQINSNTTVNNLNDHNVYAQWTANTYTVTYDSNGGNTCSPTSKKVTYASTYGTLCTPTRTGYTFNGWYTATSGGSPINTNTKVTSTKNHTLYAIWRVNVCTINYKPNGGTFRNHSTSTQQKMNYGYKMSSDSGMRNATGSSSSYYYAKRSDAYNAAVSGAEWITSDRRTFDQDKNYSATDFCPNLANGDQTVNLYVNWYDTKYRKRTCSTCKRCSGAGCSTYKSCTYTYSCSLTDTVTTSAIGVNTYLQKGYSCVDAGNSKMKCTKTTTSTCSAYGANSACGCKTYKKSCASCGCKTWSDWSDYTLNSCTKNSKTQCESKKIYPNPRFQ